MNALEYLLRFPWVEPLGRTLIHFLWQGTLLGFAAWTALRWLRRASPDLRHAVAASALVLCALCPVGTFLYLAHPWRPAPVLQEMVSSPSLIAPVNLAISTPGVLAVKPMPVARPTALPSAPPGPGFQRSPSQTSILSAFSVWRKAAIRWAVLLWIAGVTVLGGRLGIGWTRVQLWRGGAWPVCDAKIAHIFRELADRLGIQAGRARLLVSRATALPGPLAMGVLRPVVLLPARLLETLPLAQIEALLAHELAHIRRHDYLWNLLASALEVALFYHPAVWFIGRQLRVAREECCDALVAEVCPDRLVYARALAAVAECRALTIIQVPAPAAARSPLVVRVRRLLGLDIPPEPLLTSRNAGWLLALAAVALAATGILYSGKLLAQNDDDQDPAIPILVRPAPRGNVVDAAGHPMPGARVRLAQIREPWSPDNGVTDETTADAAGNFTLNKPVRFHHPDAFRRNAEYTLLADGANLAPAWIVLSPDDVPTAERHLTLTPPTHKDFVVTDRAGKPIAGAVVEMRGAYPREGSSNVLFREPLLLPANLGLRRAVTDAAGHATVEGLPDTTIHFVTSKEGFGDNTTFQSELASATQTIPLQTASVLEGRVTDPLGRPVEGATVSLEPKFRYLTYFAAKTGMDGRYRVTGIWSDREANAGQPDWGKYQVAVRHPNFTAAAREVSFSGRQTITGFDLAAVPGTELAGRLLDPQTRAPVADAVVQIDSPSGRQTFFTGTDGSFHGRVVPGEIHAFFWQAPRNRFVEEGHSGGLPTSVDTQAGGERFSLDLYLPGPLGRLGTVRGQVKTAEGRPAVRCQVTASLPGRLLIGDSRGSALSTVNTDGKGNFAIDEFPIGPAFTLDARAEDKTGAGSLAVTLKTGALDLAAPIVLQPTAPGVEFLLTDRHGKPRPNLAVAVGLVRDEQSYPVQSDRLKSDAEGVLRVPHPVPRARYAVVRLESDGVNHVVNAFDAPAAGEPSPARRPLVIDPEGVVRLLGSDGAPLPIKRFIEYGGSGIIYGRRNRWENDLPILRREGTDSVIPWNNLAGNRGGATHSVIEMDNGNYVRAEGQIPLDGSNLFVMRATAVMRPDFVPDPTIPDVAADGLAGRVVTPEGEPVSGAAIDMPGVHFQEEKVPPVLSGADGVFRVTMPRYRFTHLSIAKEGWATSFVTDVQAGQGFRVTLHRDTSLKGTVGGENPGRVALVLKTNKFTKSDQSYQHEVQNVSLRVTTDEHGAYDFPVEPGRYRWEASSADGRFANGDVSVEPGRVVDLGAALHSGYDLAIELLDCQSGQPIPGIEVAIYEERADRAYSARPDSARTSDAAGRIHWENLPAGNKHFECSRLQRAGRGTEPQPQYPYSRWWRADEPHEWLRVDYARQPPTGQNHTAWIDLDVQPGLPTVRIFMERGVKISGRVAGADGRGVPYASIEALAQHDGQLGNFDAQTDAGGNFSAYLPAGNGIAYHLCAYMFPGQNQPAPGATAISEWFQSRPGDERTFQLVMGKGGWFTGRLVTANGQPADGFKVTAVASDDLEVTFAARIVTVGPDGRFRLGPLRPGKYQVYPGKSTGAPLSKLPSAADTAGEITAAGDTRDLGDITLPSGTRRQE